MRSSLKTTSARDLKLGPQVHLRKSKPLIPVSSQTSCMVAIYRLDSKKKKFK